MNRRLPRWLTTYHHKWIGPVALSLHFVSWGLGVYVNFGWYAFIRVGPCTVKYAFRRHRPHD